MNSSKTPFILGLGAFGVLAGVVAFHVISQPAPPNIAPVHLSSVPLYAATPGDKPALALALSVEFPTVGAQYMGVATHGNPIDDSYSPANEYIGYYNAEMCYRYVNSPSETPASGLTAADYKRFAISGPASGRRCADAFSGNFLNWASSSAIDMLRMALSGGDRYIDEPGLTTLQRAVLPSHKGGFWNRNNFPSKALKKGDGSFQGAIPQAIISELSDLNKDTLWVANMGNRIYFGDARVGTGYNATNAAAYKVGARASNIGPIASSGPGSFPGALPAACAVENAGSCSAPAGAVRQIWYGANGAGWKRAPFTGTVSCNNATFGDPAPGTTKRCYITSYSGSWTPGQGNNGAFNTDGFFYARVEVCAKNPAGELVDVRDYNFCQRYPSGHYKSTGTIQKYSTQLRLAAFGYALDDTRADLPNGRVGGVLRAPMKFVGQRTYNIHGAENTPLTGNPRREWDPITGVFATNPEGDTTFGRSGVVNYLNQFGRTGQLGNYKQHDPAAELYYETLRYLQGLPPSATAIERLDLGVAAERNYYDGFPIYKDWSALDPYGEGRSNTASYACTKTNIALIGDVNTHDSGSQLYASGLKRYFPAPNIANNIPDINHWVAVVDAFEAKTSMGYVDGSGAARTTVTPGTETSNVYNRQRGKQIYGLSYWAHTHDIRGTDWTAQPAKQRPGLRVKTFVFDVNENNTEVLDPDMRRRNNQYFRAAKYGGFNTQPSGDATVPYNVEGNPFYNQNGVADNNVWQDPDNPGEAQSYFVQSNARGVLAAFEKIFGEAASTQRNIAGASSSSGGRLTTTSAYSYQAAFDTGTWSGDVLAFSVAASGDGAGGVMAASTPVWSADQVLTARLAASGHASRNIVVGSQAVTPAATATLFTATGIETALKNNLDTITPGGAPDGLWADRLAYLRGDKTREGSPFRVRFQALGDITNSGVVYVGAPSPTTNRGAGYAAYAAANASRTPVVYVGANDGMMHAFNANTGDEVFAYIPSWLGPKLSALTDPNYSHQSYADATPVVGDAHAGGNWKTVLVSGTGGGGRGVFALDVTNPGAFAPSNVMWEFSSAHDADMGYVIGKPRIVRLRTSAAGAAPAYGWFALVPSGVNNYVPDAAGRFSSTGSPTLFVLSLDKAAGTPWTLGTNYYKINLPVNLTDAALKDASGMTIASGVINVEALTDAAGVTTYVYAGDLHGKLWVLNFEGVGANDWTANKLSLFSTSGAGAYPLYHAKDAAGKPQPISAAPTIILGGSDDEHYVGFGTGKYIEASDATSTQTNSYYVVLQNGSGAATSGSAGVVGIAGRGRMQKVVMSSGVLTPEAPFTWGRPTSDGQPGLRAGWFYDMPGTGERVVYDATMVPSSGSRVAFSSLIPDSASNPGVCSVSGGTGNTYLLDLIKAEGPRVVSTVGILGQPMVDLNAADTEVTRADSTGRRLRTRHVVVTQQGSAGLSSQAVSTETVVFGRLSWRQVSNYLELRN